ncbi:Fusaric acid resistance protein-like [Rhizoctonia solani]|uniref:Fusaric acid resistance protein-like n=1 Tax=Rhizoctonia solani TaxID=456999 RepID=A0A8H7IG96_9AGAM|nr:Fusaric acid resistance protein-like [Rhizoctonia solani]
MCVTCICSVIIVLRPVASLGGPYLFLILTVKELVFPPSTSPSAQIEASVVNMSGALFGLGWSNLGLVCATYAARRYGVDSDAPRVIRAIFLLMLGRAGSELVASIDFCLAGGWTNERFFINDGFGLYQVVFQWQYTNFTQLLFVCVIASTSSLVVSFGARIFVPAGGYAKDSINALGLLKDLVHLATTRTIDPPISELTRPSSPTLTVTNHPVPTQPAQSIEALQRKCLEASLALHTSYAYSAFELRVGRVPISLIKPLLTTIGRDQLSKEELELLATLDDPSRSCADSIEDSISALQCAIGLCYGFHVPGASKTSYRAERRIVQAMRIEYPCRESKTHGCPSGAEEAAGFGVKEMNDAHMFKVQRSAFQKESYATSLLHISSEINRALTLMLSVLEIHASNRPRVFFLRPSWLWLGMSPRALFDQAQEEDRGGAEAASDADDTIALSTQEARQGVVQRRDKALLMSPAVQYASPVPVREKMQKTWENIRSTPLNLETLSNLIDLPRRILVIQWNKSNVLHFRVWLSRAVRKVQHSKHARHAIKHAFGITLLAIPSFLPTGTPGRTYFVSQRGVWAIISFVYVLEPNTALTWRLGIMRLCGTFIGAVYAYVTWAICRENPYGIVIMLTVGEIMLTFLIRTSTPGVGIVASITMPPIIFTPYLGLPHPSVIGLAALRGAQVAIGIVAAILINHFVFPRHCRVMFLEGMAQVLSKETALFLHLSQRTLNEAARTRNGMVRGAKMDLRLREMIAREKLLLTQMVHEVSLMPKPTDLYREATETVQRIADLMSGLRRIRENVPQKEAIHQVLQYRQHTISCVCIILFAANTLSGLDNHSPDFTVPRKAFDDLRREMMDALQSTTRATDVAYAIAENEVYEELIDAIEMLITITRELFGTNRWLSDGVCSFGISGIETPAVHSSAASLRRMDSFH